MDRFVFVSSRRCQPCSKILSRVFSAIIKIQITLLLKFQRSRHPQIIPHRLATFPKHVCVNGANLVKNDAFGGKDLHASVLNYLQSKLGSWFKFHITILQVLFASKNKIKLDYS